MKTLSVLNLFSGIGGFEIGMELASRYLRFDYKIVGLCEQDSYCRQVLATRFPNTPVFEDAKTLTLATLQSVGITNVDILTASPPCQPFSVASNKRRGNQDDRDLFPTTLRLLGELRPRLCVIENVRGLLSINNGEYFKQILLQIAQVGYDAIWQVLSCAQLQGVHKRERVFVIAYPSKSPAIAL